MTDRIDTSSHRVGRRDALKIGGLTVSLAALAAACGEDRTGDASGGRVGYAPPITDPPDYAVDDAVLLRTASSLELTAVLVYETFLETGALDGDVVALVERIAENHRTLADEMGQLTESVGGTAWECTNPWLMDRLVTPLVAAIETSDDPARDMFNTAVALENLAVATHQTLTIQLSDSDASEATLAAATLESRHSAALVSAVRGSEGYLSPVLSGEEAPLDDSGVPQSYAITSRLGSTGQSELVVGAPNENGVRETFILLTPAANSYIYNELEPSC